MQDDYAPIADGIEAVARALCAADGNDPDALGYVGVPYIVGRGRGFGAGREAVPLWHLYSQDATVAVLTMADVAVRVMEDAG